MDKTIVNIRKGYDQSFRSFYEHFQKQTCQHKNLQSQSQVLPWEGIVAARYMYAFTEENTSVYIKNTA